MLFVLLCFLCLLWLVGNDQRLALPTFFEIVGQAFSIFIGHLVNVCAKQPTLLALFTGSIRRDDLHDCFDCGMTLTGVAVGGGSDGNFTAGDDYTTTFGVGVPDVDTRIVSLPDFSRGPGQAVGVPGTGTILPIKIDLATSVTAVKELRVTLQPHRAGRAKSARARRC